MKAHKDIIYTDKEKICSQSLNRFDVKLTVQFPTCNNFKVKHFLKVKN